LLDAALHVFGERGFTAAKLEEVAKRAGVCKGTVYLYFDSKDALFREMVRAKIGVAVTEFETFASEFEGTAPALLEALLRKLWHFVNHRDRARLARVVISEISNFPDLARFYFDEVVLRVRRVLRQAIERGIAEGAFRKNDAEFTARAMQILAVQLAQYQHFMNRYDPAPQDDDRVLANLLDLALHGLAPAKPARSSR
jgi:AcrR family transcriptional regulator